MSEPTQPAIDWAGVGRGPLGEEIGLLVGVAALFGEVELERARDLVEIAFASYVGGLRSTGWDGNVEAVRFCSLASMVLQVAIGYLPIVIGRLRDESWCAAYERETGGTIAQLVERRHRPRNEFYLDQAAVVRELLRRL